MAGIALLSTGAISLAAPQAAPASLEQQLQTFLQWFPGEYDNYEQVYADTENQVEQIHEHIHHIFYPASSPSMGDHVFFVQQYMDGNPQQIYRQRLYRFSIDAEESALRLDIFSFKNEDKYRNAFLTPDILTDLTPDELIERPGCEVYWRFAEKEQNAFHGYMHEKTCSFVSERSGKRIYITDDLRLTRDQIWIRDEAFDENGGRVFGNRAGIHHKNRKVQYYSGWAGISSEGPLEVLEDGNWESHGELWEYIGDLDNFSRFVLHNEGQIVPVLDKSGNNSGYSVQLARLTYANTTVPTLTLKIIDDATRKTLAYSWGQPDATRLGINTRWAQSGTTLRTGDAASFGWLGDD
jgi:hypothetical protein